MMYSGFSHDVFANGGLLELWMSPKPNKNEGRTGNS